jgi:hypothetical protein
VRSITRTLAAEKALQSQDIPKSGKRIDPVRKPPGTAAEEAPLELVTRQVLLASQRRLQLRATDTSVARDEARGVIPRLPHDLVVG